MTEHLSAAEGGLRPGSPARSGKALLSDAASGTARGFRRARYMLRRDGAGHSGLATLVELCTVNAAGDALVAVALAGTVFFNVPVGQARGKVALYLLITMAPFALLAPVIGPALDKLHARRIAMAGSMLARAILCWVLAGHHDNLELYPLALGLLVTSRAFGIARAAVTPRVLPHGTSLLSANSRVTLVGAVAAAVVAPPALGIGSLIGIGWVLRAGSLVFLAAIVLCLHLPAHVDNAKGETAAIGLARSTFAPRAGSRVSRALGDLPNALRAVLCLRALVGFLTLFLAFELRTAGSGKSSLAGLAIAAVLGQTTGVTIGNRLGRRRPELLIATGLMLATAACLVGAILYSRTGSLIVALFATMGAALGKLGLDAVIQRDIAETSRASAFARSETALQICWVAGGAIGLAPISGRTGLSIAAVGMVAALLVEVLALRRARLDGRRPATVPDVIRRRKQDVERAKAATQPSAPPPNASPPNANHPTANQPTATQPGGWQQSATIAMHREPPTGPGGTMLMPFDDA